MTFLQYSLNFNLKKQLKMLNVQDHYTYRNKSSDKVNNVAIHPLSMKSFNEYMSNTSYANKFIDKSKLIKDKNYKGINLTENCDENYKIENNRNISNVYFNDFEFDNNEKKFYSTQYPKRNDSEQLRKNMLNNLNEDKSYMKLVKRYTTSNKNKFISKANFVKNENSNIDINSHSPTNNGLLHIKKTKKIKDNLKNSNKNFDGLKKTNNDIDLNNLNQYSNNYNNINVNSANSGFKNSNHFNSKNDILMENNDNTKNNSPKDFNNYNPLSFTLINKNPNGFNKNTSFNFYNNNSTNNPKLKIRSSSIENFNNYNDLKSSKASSKHDGFTLHNIPRVDDLYKMSDPKYLNYSHTNFHCKKIINSLHMSNNLKVNDEIQKISKVELRKVNKAKSPKEFVNKLCDLENSKYGRIFNMQKSQEFLEEKKLPEIKYEKKNIEISKNFYNNGNSKFMGIKYNPYNFDLITSKNRTKRNVFGTLFIN